MPLETTPFDPARYLTRPESQAELLEDAFNSGDTTYIAHALEVIARAREIAGVANDEGDAADGSNIGLAEAGDPRLSTLLGVVKPLGLKLSVAPQKAAS